MEQQKEKYTCSKCGGIISIHDRECSECQEKMDDEMSACRRLIIFIREYRSADCSEIAKLFYNTVHTVNTKDYTKEQLDVWATGWVDLEKWDQSFQEHYCVVAVEDDIIIGFGDIDKTGYLDRLYVHADYQGEGIASAICDQLEQAVDMDRITTHASITARPFFEKRGYRMIREQQVVRDGIILTNYLMENKR